MPLTLLGDVGLDQFGFFGLVIVGVGGQDLDAILGAGIGVTLDHALHELVILEYNTGDRSVPLVLRVHCSNFCQTIGFAPCIHTGGIGGAEPVPGTTVILPASGLVLPRRVSARDSTAR